jgi:hypothetical protein
MKAVPTAAACSPPLVTYTHALSHWFSLASSANSQSEYTLEVRNLMLLLVEAGFLTRSPRNSI